MKSFITLAIAATVSAIESNDAFKFMLYVSAFGKDYTTIVEYTHRMENFLKSELQIVEHNA